MLPTFILLWFSLHFCRIQLLFFASARILSWHSAFAIWKGYNRFVAPSFVLIELKLTSGLASVCFDVALRSCNDGKSHTSISIFNNCSWEVVVAQLAERSLTIPEDPGSNPVIGSFYWTFNYCKLFVEKTKIRKRGREWPFFKKKTIAVKK